MVVGHVPLTLWRVWPCKKQSTQEKTIEKLIAFTTVIEKLRSFSRILLLSATTERISETRVLWPSTPQLQKNRAGNRAGCREQYKEALAIEKI